MFILEQNEQHILNVENCKRITATGIISVDAFSATQLILSYGGGRIVVSGSEMKITSFSKTNGQFSASGVITAVKYAGKAVGLKQKLFK